MKWKFRYVRQYESQIEAVDVRDAERQVLAVLGLEGAKLLGIIPQDEKWHDEEGSTPTRPPRNKPPSGSPGTPTVAMPTKVLNAYARAG